MTERTNITPLQRENCLEQLPTTINRISLDNKTNQLETTVRTNFKKLFETNHTIKNTEVKIQIKPGCYQKLQKAQPIPYRVQDDVKNELDRLKGSGHLEKLETIEEDCFVSPVVFTVKKDKTLEMRVN